MTPSGSAWHASSNEKNPVKEPPIPSLMLKPMNKTQASHSIPLPSNHVHRTESEVQLQAGLEAAERRNLRMFYRLVNGIRMRQESPKTAPVESYDSWSSAPADANSILFRPENQFSITEGTSLDYEEVAPADGWQRSSSAPPCVANDDWSITGFSDHRPLTEIGVLSDTEDAADDDGVFDIDM
jgi:hypothetical protein